MSRTNFGGLHIVDPVTGKNVNVESNGGLAVNIQDQTSPLFDLYFLQAIGAPTTISSAVTIGDTDIEVVSGANLSVGDYMGVFCPTEGRYFFAEVLANDAETPATISVDTPSDFAFDIGDNVISTTRNLSVNGSLASPEVFIVSGPGAGSSIEIDITRIIMSMVVTSQPDDSLFGNIAKLVNGIVLRHVNGETRNIFNIKDNADFANVAYDLTYTARTTPASSYGIRWRYTFAGQDKHGVVVRLGVNETLQLLVQDNLTGISAFRIMAQGHTVTD